MKDGIRAKGFFRVQIEENGKIVGNSGWKKNMVTNLGLEYYLARCLMGQAGSLQVGYVALGTGGAPASDAVTLPGEISASTKRKAVTTNFSSRTINGGSCTVQFTATFGSTDNFLAGASNLSNIGLFNGTTTTNTLFAGNTYASSSCNTNQNVNVTYQIRLG
jgi:hypothetical protein